MKRFFFPITLAALLALAPVGHTTEAAEPVASPTPAASSEEVTPASVVKAFFIRLGKNEVDEAYDELLAGTRIAETPADVLMLKKNTRDALKLVGGIRGAELLESHTRGTHLQSLNYVSLGAEYPLQWRFFFYKRSSGWKLIDIRISDRLPELFGEKVDPATPPKQ